MLEKQGHSEVEEVQYRPTVHHWWGVQTTGQTKRTRQTYRQSIETTRRQFTKRWKIIIRPRKHTTKELRNISVKLNWEDHIWNLFITMVNKICICVMYTYTYIHIYIHTQTHTHTVKYRFYILVCCLYFYTYCAYLQTSSHPTPLWLPNTLTEPPPP